MIGGTISRPRPYMPPGVYDNTPTRPMVPSTPPRSERRPLPYRPPSVYGSDNEMPIRSFTLSPRRLNFDNDDIGTVITKDTLEEKLKLDKATDTCHTTCSICLNNDDKMCKLPCGHPFHRSCVIQWFIVSLKHTQYSCPYCRTKGDIMNLMS